MSPALLGYDVHRIQRDPREKTATYHWIESAGDCGLHLVLTVFFEFYNIAPASRRMESVGVISMMAFGEHNLLLILMGVLAHRSEDRVDRRHAHNCLVSHAVLNICAAHRFSA
jgi:hypothetical protein